MEKILINKVKEQGIVDIIIDYKKHLEWVELFDEDKEPTGKDWCNIFADERKIKNYDDFYKQYNDKVIWKYKLSRKEGRKKLFYTKFPIRKN